MGYWIQKVINRKYKVSKLVINDMNIFFLFLLYKSVLVPNLNQNDHLTEGGSGLRKTASMRVHLLKTISIKWLIS